MRCVKLNSLKVPFTHEDKVIQIDVENIQSCQLDGFFHHFNGDQKVFLVTFISVYPICHVERFCDWWTSLSYLISIICRPENVHHLGDVKADEVRHLYTFLIWFRGVFAWVRIWYKWIRTCLTEYIALKPIRQVEKMLKNPCKKRMTEKDASKSEHELREK